MRPTLAEAFRRAIERGRNLGPGGQALTMERVTRVLGTGDVEIGGVRIPVAGEGLRTLRAGDQVSVAWQRGRPVVAIAHSARRSGAPVPLPLLAGGIVEELFIATDPETDLKEVWFRNDQQITSLAIRNLLPADPTRVRWGESMRHFVVETGEPTAQDLANQAVHPFGFLRVVKQYHLFQFTDGTDPLQVLGADEPEVQLLATFSPYSSTLTLFTLRLELDYLERIDGVVIQRNQTELAESTTEDPLPPGFHATQTVTLDAVTFTAVEGPGFQSASLARPRTLEEVLNGKNQNANPEDPGIWFGTVEDFGADRAGQVWLLVRASFHRIEEATQGGEADGSTTVFQQESSPCGLSTATQPSVPGSVGAGYSQGEGADGTGTYGESHAFLVSLGAGQVLWKTTKDEALLSSVIRAAEAAPVIQGTRQRLFHNPTGTAFPNINGVFRTQDQDIIASEPNCRDQPFIDPLTVGGITFNPDPYQFGGEAFAYTPSDFYANGVASRRTAMWDEARLAFIDTELDMTADEIQSHLRRVALHLSFDGETFNNATPFLLDWVESGFGPVVGVDNTSGLDLTAEMLIDRTVRTYQPVPVWTYRLRHVANLDTGNPQQNIAPTIALVVDRIRVVTPGAEPTFEKELGVFIFDSTGTWQTLRPFASTGAGEVPDEFADEDLKDDGADVEILSGNRFHLLWTLSTAAERAANVRHIKLTRISPLTTVDVGSDWTEFANHDFRVLNLDVLYAAKDNEEHKFFVQAWDPETDAPTLSQAGEGYPVEDTELEPVKALADLDAETPEAGTRELQAVNDEEALAQTGRDLKPEVV